MPEGVLYLLGIVGKLGLGAFAFAVVSSYIGTVVFRMLHERPKTPSLESSSGWLIRQSSMRRLKRTLIGTKIPEVNIRTDGEFIDTAIFFLVAHDAAKRSPEAKIRIRHVEWDNLIHEFGIGANLVTYINRRHLAKIDVPVAIWSNVAAFKGYALLGRPEDFPSEILTLAEANERLRQLSRTKRLRIITNGADSVDVLNTPLTPLLNSQNVDIEIDPSGDGMGRFLRGRGDLFIAGLPQVLQAKRAGMVEVVSSENHPLMLGIEAIVYDVSGVPTELLNRISQCWSRTCQEIITNPDYARKKYAEWCRMAGKIGCEIRFPEEDFLLATCGAPGRYINFFTRRDETAEEIIRASESIMDESAALGLAPRNTRRVLHALQDVLSSHQTPMNSSDATASSK